MTRDERIIKFGVGLYPLFTVRYNGLMKALPNDWMPTSGVRSMIDQARLYASGRTAPGKIVTNAQAGSSAHNFGCAADLCIFDAQGQPVYEHDRWEELADAACLCGLRWGGTFPVPDRPHVELRISIRYNEVGNVYRASGLTEALALINKSIVR